MRPVTVDRPCRGPSRRDLLRVGLLGAWGLGLADLLQLRAKAAGAGVDRPARATSCILIWLAGGPSHIDTFDPKPDAPGDVKGEFQPIETAVPGLRISEVFPNLAGVMDRVTLVRSVTTPEMDHERAAQHLLTGYRPSPALVYPSVGSVVARSRGFARSTLPPYAAIPDAPLFASSGYLTPAYDPFAVGGDPNQETFRVRDLTPPDTVTLDRLRRRRAMVGRLDGFAARDVAATPLTASRDQFIRQAYELLTSSAAQEAFRIGQEPPATRDRYGRTPLGQSCLLARRLIEAGVSFVTINDRGTQQLGWDTHAQNFATIKTTLAPPIDRGVSALIRDLAERGLLESTLLVMMGEFGRTPQINGNAGRDHHGRANSVLLAGGGVPGGLVVGRTDAKADAPVERPVTPADLAATLYTALGIDPNHQFETPDGQPIRLVDKGQALHEVL
ncbi:MAG TPA: DUF1501 domain-containing protein [Isosphaeraceae bacterium]